MRKHGKIVGMLYNAPNKQLTYEQLGLQFQHHDVLDLVQTGYVCHTIGNDGEIVVMLRLEYREMEWRELITSKGKEQTS